MSYYIDRQAAIYQAYKMESIDRQPRACRRIIKIFEEWPSADVEPVRHGRWIAVTDGSGRHECSNCHWYAPYYMNGDERLSEYCPHCGARMDGGEEAETTEDDYEWSEEEQAYIPKHIAGNKYDDINVDEVVCDMGDFLGGEVDISHV